MCALAAGGEKGLEEGSRFFGEDARDDFDAVVEARVGEDFETGADGTTFGIVGAVDEARNAGLNHGAGAHRAGLDRDVKSGSSKAIVCESASGFAEDDDFGVSGRVDVANGAIARPGDDFVFEYKDGADGDFTGFGGGSSFSQRELHVVKISGHFKKNSTSIAVSRRDADAAEGGWATLTRLEWGNKLPNAAKLEEKASSHTTNGNPTRSDHAKLGGAGTPGTS